MARAEPRRLVLGNQPAREVEPGGGERRLVQAVRRPLDAGHFRQPRLPADDHDRVIATTQERLVALDADTGNVVWERRVNDFHSDVRYDRAALGVAGRRSGHRQHLYVHGRGGAAGVLARRQGSVGSLAARGVRRHHHARRPHHLAHRRGRQGHPEYADSELGSRPRPPWQPLLRLRQGAPARRSG